MSGSMARAGAVIPLAMLLWTSVSQNGCNLQGSRAVTESDIRVVCSQDLGLDEESGIRTDWNDTRIAWTAIVAGDTLLLQRRGICGDECGFREELTLSNLSDTCPSFVWGAYMERRGGSPGKTRSDTLVARDGTLKIQDWDYPSGIVSGKLESEVTFTFFVDFGKKKER